MNLLEVWEWMNNFLRLCNGYNHLSMLGFKLNYVSKRGNWLDVMHRGQIILRYFTVITCKIATQNFVTHVCRFNINLQSYQYTNSHPGVRPLVSIGKSLYWFVYLSMIIIPVLQWTLKRLGSPATRLFVHQFLQANNKYFPHKGTVVQKMFPCHGVVMGEIIFILKRTPMATLTPLAGREYSWRLSCIQMYRYFRADPSRWMATDKRTLGGD